MRHRSSESSGGSIGITSLSAITHILEHRPERILRLRLSAHPTPRVERILSLANQVGLRVEKGLPKSGKGQRSEPVVAELAPFQYDTLDSILKKTEKKKRSLIVVLDHLQDPQNLGALCRTAEALGADALCVPKDRSASIGQGVYQASVGAVETVAIAKIGNVADTLEKLKKEHYWTVGADHGPQSHPVTNMPDFERIALVLGAEETGIAPRVASCCDYLVRIPMAGKIESMNVSTAGAILMWHWASTAKS